MPANANFDPNTANMSELEQLKNENIRMKTALENIYSTSFDAATQAPTQAYGNLGIARSEARIGLGMDMRPGTVGP